MEQKLQSNALYGRVFYTNTNFGVTVLVDQNHALDCGSVDTMRSQFASALVDEFAQVVRTRADPFGVGKKAITNQAGKQLWFRPGGCPHPHFTFADGDHLSRHAGGTHFFNGLCTWITHQGGEIVERNDVYVPFSSRWVQGFSLAALLFEKQWETTESQFQEVFGESPGTVEHDLRVLSAGAEQ